MEPVTQSLAILLSQSRSVRDAKRLDGTAGRGRMMLATAERNFREHRSARMRAPLRLVQPRCRPVACTRGLGYTTCTSSRACIRRRFLRFDRLGDCEGIAIMVRDILHTFLHESTREREGDGAENFLLFAGKIRAVRLRRSGVISPR